ncbi:MAG: SPOR domain-containing protein [Thalassotalea sp.]
MLKANILTIVISGFILTSTGCTSVTPSKSKTIKENAINATTLYDHIDEWKNYKQQTEDVVLLKKEINELKEQVALLTKKHQILDKQVMKGSALNERLKDQTPTNTINHIAIQFGSYGTELALEHSWQNLQSKYKDQFTNKELLVESIQNNDKTIYRLKVIPFVDKNDAKQVCDYFKSIEQACLVTTYQ